ncbi:MAG: flavodoxin domain-containing protein [Micrococcales bacterium]|nr:flavodoxin domain-containing protein [Micrococcales bacterium]
MRVLLAVASRHGATWEIGSSIAKTLEGRGHDPHLVSPEAVTSLEGYDAAIVGSAVYITQLLPSARSLLERLGPDLVEIPLWLFASGLARPSSGAKTTAYLAQLTEQLGAYDHRLFRGRLERAGLSFTERVAAAGVLNREGDHRDFEVIERWADEIADVLDQVKADTRPL